MNFNSLIQQVARLHPAASSILPLGRTAGSCSATVSAHIDWGRRRAGQGAMKARVPFSDASGERLPGMDGITSEEFYLTNV